MTAEHETEDHPAVKGKPKSIALELELEEHDPFDHETLADEPC